MTRIITPTQISIFAISKLAAELEELVIRKKFKDEIPPKSLKDTNAISEYMGFS